MLTKLVEMLLNNVHFMPMVPTDGLWITELPCTIQHIHTGYKGMRLMAPAIFHFLGQSSQILTNGLIPNWDRSQTMLTLKDNQTCHSMICQTVHAIGQKDQCSAPPARQATPSFPRFPHLPASLSLPPCMRKSRLPRTLGNVVSTI